LRYNTLALVSSSRVCWTTILYNRKTLHSHHYLVSLKGLLTYRTIQFSMSKGCFHPKFQRGSRPNLFPIQGKKSPRADSCFLNSASQTTVSTRLNYFYRARLSTVFFATTAFVETNVQHLI